MRIAIPAAALALAACTSAASTPGTGAQASPSAAVVTGAPGSISLGVSSLGPILVDSNGMSVYLLTADQPNASTCTGQCLRYWPLVAASGAPTANAGVTATITALKRSDGTEQLAANGWPLYTYGGDAKPGDVNGQGATSYGGTWYVLSAAGAAVKGAPSASPTKAGGYGGAY